MPDFNEEASQDQAIFNESAEASTEADAAANESVEAVTPDQNSSENSAQNGEDDFAVELPDLSYDQLEKVKEAAIAKQRVQRERERDADLNTVKVLIAKHDLKWADIKPVKERSKVAPKYRNPETGATWTGRGKAPLWIRDHADRTPFLING